MSSTPASHRVAQRTLGFTESVIREMTRVAREFGSLNLAQGFPDFPAPQILKDAACEAIQADVNQYAITWGSPSFREALVEKYANWYGFEVDPMTELTVTCGATEAMAAVTMALIDPGSEVIVLEPFYENYGPDVVLAGAVPVFLPLEGPDYSLDLDRLSSLITSRTAAIILNTPNNPTGRVFTPEEMAGIAKLCRTHDLLLITDEIYEHILYEGRHIPACTLDGMRERTVTLSGASKTFSVTGWRIGTVVAPPPLTAAIRKVHDFLTVGAPAPLQEACAVAMRTLGEEYYSHLISSYRERRDTLFEALKTAGYRCLPPAGAYYILADFSQVFPDLDDRAFSHLLARDGGVAPVPGSSFFSSPKRGSQVVRFAFCKQLETLKEAGKRLIHFSEKQG